MNQKIIFAVVFVLIFSTLLFFGVFKTTGFATNSQKLLVSLDIPPDQQKIKPGDSLLLKVDLRVPGGYIDQTSLVELEYSVKDLDGNIISSKIEGGAIAVKESEVASLLIPTTTKPGVYTAFVSVRYEGEIYEGSKTFEVSNNLYNLNMIFYILAALAALLLVIIIIKKIKSKNYY